MYKIMNKSTSVNIASHLPAMAEINPHGMAVVFPQGTDKAGRVSYTHYTLSQLNKRSDDIAHGLEAVGIKRGTRTCLMVTPSLDFFALTFALFKVGAVPVMIDPGIGIKNLGICLAEAEPEAFIGVPKAQVGRIILGWAKKTVKIVITVGNKFLWGGYTLEEIIEKGSPGKPYKMAETKPDEVAAILFTSGSTGVSKGAVYTHGIFNAQVKLIRLAFGIEPGDMDLATFPLFSLFGPALGMAAVIPDMDASKPAEADPEKLFQAIEDFGTTNMFASPALINKLGRYGEKHGRKLTSLKRVISCGAPASPKAIKRFSTMLNPGVEIFTPYGATEALPLCKVGSKEILEETGKMTDEGKGVCVGKSIEGITLKVIKISDDPIPKWSDDLLLKDGEIGEYAAKGDVVTREYFNRPKNTELAKIIDKENGGFYHRMGDVGYKDEKGRFWYCGRKAHRVETKDETLFTIPCEAVFNVHPKVYRTALVGWTKNGSTKPVLCVELEKGHEDADKNKIKEELMKIAKSHPHTKNIETILFHPSFPVDIRHNAKIFREKLTVWAEGELS